MLLSGNEYSYRNMHNICYKCVYDILLHIYMYSWLFFPQEKKKATMAEWKALDAELQEIAKVSKIRLR